MRPEQFVKHLSTCLFVIGVICITVGAWGIASAMMLPAERPVPTFPGPSAKHSITVHVRNVPTSYLEALRARLASAYGNNSNTVALTVASDNTVTQHQTVTLAIQSFEPLSVLLSGVRGYLAVYFSDVTLIGVSGT